MANNICCESGELIVPAATIEVRKMHLASQARGKRTAYFAIIPTGSRLPHKLPVLYLLHGAWDSYTAWLERAEHQLRRLARQYGLMIILPDGDPFGWYADSPFDPANQIETYLIDELIPHVEANLPTNPTLRSIAGLSMGGQGALGLYLRNPGLFRSASSMSGILDITRHAEQWELTRVFGKLTANRALWERHSVLSLVQQLPQTNQLPWLVTVSLDDVLALEDNQLVQQELEWRGIAHEYRESPGNHDWEYWTAELPLHVGFHAKYLNLLKSRKTTNLTPP